MRNERETQTVSLEFRFFEKQITKVFACFRFVLHLFPNKETSETNKINFRLLFAIFANFASNV
jgi:hypothetical protein